MLAALPRSAPDGRIAWAAASGAFVDRSRESAWGELPPGAPSITGNAVPPAVLAPRGTRSDTSPDARPAPLSTIRSAVIQGWSLRSARPASSRAGSTGEWRLLTSWNLTAEFGAINSTRASRRISGPCLPTGATSKSIPVDRIHSGKVVSGARSLSVHWLGRVAHRTRTPRASDVPGELPRDRQRIASVLEEVVKRGPCADSATAPPL